MQHIYPQNSHFSNRMLCEWWKYPYFSIADINSLKPVTAKADLEKQMLDRAGDWVTVACDWLLRLVTKGLGKRVELLCLKPEEEVEVCFAYGSWVLCINCDLCASQCMPRMVAVSVLCFFLCVYDKDHTCMSALRIKNRSERDLRRSIDTSCHSLHIMVINWTHTWPASGQAS